MKLYSFDVFDTLITRSTATPKGIFAIMQRRMEADGFGSEAGEFIKNNFFQLRIGAEQVARNTHCINGIEDVTLEQIYDVLVKESHMTRKSAEHLCELERQTEMDFSVGIPENISKVRQLIRKKEKVILISDMYLDRDTIRRMLVKADDIFADIPLYVSSDEEKKGKWTGNLFRVIQEKEQVPYSEWEHMGDNENSDYRIPRQLGIKCIKYEPERLLQIEETYLKNHESDAEVQLSLGCARAARIEGEKNTAYRLGCSIGGSILYRYVCWLLEDCAERGVRRLYFIARDGYILKELADCLIRQNGYGIETKYIYGSRLAWRIPSGSNLSEDMWDIYKHSYQELIFCSSDLADFFQVPEELVCRYLPSGMKEPDIIWMVDMTDMAVRRLLQCPAFLAEIKVWYDKKKELLVKYLQQEIDTSDDRFAFVDLAGSGLTQECLAKVMGEYYQGEINNYFFRKDTVSEGICQNHVFYPNYVPYFVLLEMTSRAPHGQTIGYREETDGKVVPVMSEVDGRAIIDHQVENFIEGVKKFGVFYDEKRRKGKVNLGIGNILYYLDYIYNSPDKEVLDYFADMPNMLTGREKGMTAYAPKLTDRDIKNIYWYRDKEIPQYFYKGTDINYSLKRCSDRQKKKMERYQKYRSTWYGKMCRKVHAGLACGRNAARVATIYDYAEKNIAIYGAGKKGKLFYEQITGKRKVNGQKYHSNVVVWMDRNYMQYQAQGMDVSSPEDVCSVRFDQIFIAMAKKAVADDVKKMLLEKGIEEYKILWINPIQ